MSGSCWAAYFEAASDWKCLDAAQGHTIALFALRQGMKNEFQLGDVNGGKLALVASALDQQGVTPTIARLFFWHPLNPYGLVFAVQGQANRTAI